MKNAAVNVKVVDWGIDPTSKVGWVELELTGSLQDENGQVVLNPPETRRINLDHRVEPKIPMKRFDPRQKGPI